MTSDLDIKTDGKTPELSEEEDDGMDNFPAVPVYETAAQQQIFREGMRYTAEFAHRLLAEGPAMEMNRFLKDSGVEPVGEKDEEDQVHAEN